MPIVSPSPTLFAKRTVVALAVLRAAVADDSSANGPDQVPLAIWLDHYGESALAAKALYRAFVEHGYGLYAPLRHSIGPAVRREPRYKQLLVDVGFIGCWRETGVWNDFCRPQRGGDFDCADSTDQGPALRLPGPRTRPRSRRTRRNELVDLEQRDAAVAIGDSNGP